MWRRRCLKGKVKEYVEDVEKKDEEEERKEDVEKVE